jgi:hypothetical protein
MYLLYWYRNTFFLAFVPLNRQEHCDWLCQVVAWDSFNLEVVASNWHWDPFNLEVVASNWHWDSFNLEVVVSNWYWDSFNLAFTLFNRQKYCDWLFQFVGFNWYLNSFKILIIFFSIEHYGRSISFCPFWLDYLCDPAYFQ